MLSSLKERAISTAIAALDSAENQFKSPDDEEEEETGWGNEDEVLESDGDPFADARVRGQRLWLTRHFEATFGRAPGFTEASEAARSLTLSIGEEGGEASRKRERRERVRCRYSASSEASERAGI